MIHGTDGHESSEAEVWTLAQDVVNQCGNLQRVNTTLVCESIPVVDNWFLMKVYGEKKRRERESILINV